MNHRYHIDVFWSDEDECWIANIPDLKSCSAYGDTPVEAVTEVQVAIGLCLDYYCERGVPAPEATYRSAASLSRSAKS